MIFGQKKQLVHKKSICDINEGGSAMSENDKNLEKEGGGKQNISAERILSNFLNNKNDGNFCCPLATNTLSNPLFALLPIQISNTYTVQRLLCFCLFACLLPRPFQRIIKRKKKLVVLSSEKRNDKVISAKYRLCFSIVLNTLEIVGTVCIGTFVTIKRKKWTPNVLWFFFWEGWDKKVFKLPLMWFKRVQMIFFFLFFTFQTT